MEMNPDQNASFSVKHCWSGWINLCFSVISVLVLVIAFNCFSHRHYQRISWADNLKHNLSERTQQLLTNMTNEVDIIVFYDSTESTFRMVDELLQQYVHLNPNALRPASFDDFNHCTIFFPLTREQSYLSQIL